MFVVRISADRPWEAGMLISPALAHGTSGAAAGGFGPLILVVVAVVFVLVPVGEKKWRGRKLARDGNGE